MHNNSEPSMDYGPKVFNVIVNTTLQQNCEGKQQPWN
jgi:hypothetical protein